MGKRRKRKLRYGRLFIVVLLFALMGSGVYKLGDGVLEFVSKELYESDLILNTGQANIDDESEKIKEPQEPEELSIEVNEDFKVDELHSTNAIFISLSEDKVLLEKESDAKVYPASLTKIMTTVVALENIGSLQETVLLPEEIFEKLYAANASRAGFLPGEEVVVIDLLYGTLLSSGADASVGLAIHIAESEDEFVKQMNEKASELGMKGTRFANVTGLHDDNNYTTVKDVSILLEYALQDETFREIFTSSQHLTEATNLHGEGITLSSTLFKNMDRHDFEGGKILGGKTGYTGEAGLCLASLGKKDGREYILVTVGAPGDHQTEQFHIKDVFTVYDKFLK